MTHRLKNKAAGTGRRGQFVDLSDECHRARWQENRIKIGAPHCGASELEDGAAAELTLQDFVENAVVKISDEVEVDVSRQA